MIPTRLLPHTVTLQTAGSQVDEYGDTVEDWDNPVETTIAARVEFTPVGGSETTKDRDGAISMWRIFTNDPITLTSRIVWDALTFLVEGEVAPVYAAQTLHHYEAALKLAS